MFSVMIVDDEEIIRFELRRTVAWEEMGFKIEYEAINGYDALEKLGDRHIDLLVSDIKMPKIDGLELYRELKEKDQCSCAVFLSGHNDFEYVRPALVLGAIDYILKPFDSLKVADVLSRVNQFLAGKKKEQEEKSILLDMIKTGQSLYPMDSERKLFAMALQGDNAAVGMMESITRELDAKKCEPAIVRQITSTVISNVAKNVLGQYSYLANIYDMGKLEGITEITGEGIEEIVAGARKAIAEILGIINTFKLNQKDNIVIRACEYVLKNIESDISLKDISDQFFISRNYFCSLFKKETGENFLEYVTKAKMERAKILLKENNLKAYEVSGILGYKETSYFSKLFKKYTGYSPTEYRKYTFNDNKAADFH